MDEKKAIQSIIEIRIAVLENEIELIEAEILNENNNELSPTYFLEKKKELKKLELSDMETIQHAFNSKYADMQKNIDKKWGEK